MHQLAWKWGPPGPLPGGGGGGAPGPPPGGGGGGAPAPPAPAPAPAGGGGGAAIINAHLSWLLSLTLCPNTALKRSMQAPWSLVVNFTGGVWQATGVACS